MANQPDATDFSGVLAPGSMLGACGGWRPAVGSRIAVPQVTLNEEVVEVGATGPMKIDVQGYEASVLADAKAYIGRTAAILIEVNFIEPHDGESGFDEIHHPLSAAGFRHTGFSPPSLNGEGIPVWVDAVYARATPCPVVPRRPA